MRVLGVTVRAATLPPAAHMAAKCGIGKTNMEARRLPLGGGRRDRGKFPANRECFASGAESCRISLFRTEAWPLSGRFPGAANWDIGRAEQRASISGQRIAAMASPLLRVSAGA